MSFSVRFNSNLITIWNRDATNQRSINGILEVLLKLLSPELTPKDGSYYYKRHSEHTGFNEVVTKATESKADHAAKIDGEGIPEAVVTEDKASTNPSI